MRTGCLSILKKSEKNNKTLFVFVKKVTTLVAFIICSHFISSTAAQSNRLEIVQQEKTSNYNRIIFFAGRDQLNFKKAGASIQLTTLNEELFKLIKNELAGIIGTENAYVNKVSGYKDEGNTNAFIINFELKSPNIEMFSFYREREKKYVMDMWIDGEDATLSKIKTTEAVSPTANQLVEVEDSVKVTAAQTEKTIQTETALKKVKKANVQVVTEKETKLTDKSMESKVQRDEVLKSIVVDPNSKLQLTVKEDELSKEAQRSAYRDFRYGATFFWDYEPIVPSMKDAVNIESKIPEVFYPIVNRKFEKNEREAHLQLTINLYRKKNFGLMNKSITLFQEKYGDKAEWELLEYLKVNALLRENIEKPNPEIFKNAIGRLNGIVDRSDNYEIKKGIWKYLLTHYLQKQEFLKTLQVSKEFYAGTRTSFDFEESPYPAEVMLYSLARLGQVQQLSALAQEKNIRKVVAPATILSYQSFAKLKSNEIDGVISLYEKSRSGVIGELPPAVLYNSAEAYFRKGDYLKAFSMYQRFTKEFPYELTASNAQLRMAFCSDILERNFEETLALYKDAVDKAINSDVSYEARLRYVSFRSVRKKILDDRDREIRIFLEQDKTTTQVLNKNLQKLLYQVRLRTLIVDGKFKEALAYYSLIPIAGMSKVDARTFVADAAEIAYGLIEENYKNSEYTQVIKHWQTFKDIYVNKVAGDPYLKFIVGSAYVKLGMFNGFDGIYALFKESRDEPSRKFPLWVPRPRDVSAENLLAELSIIKDLKLKNIELALKEVEALIKITPENMRLFAYRGQLKFFKKEYPLAIADIEMYLSAQTEKSIYDPQEIADIIRAYTDSIYEINDTEKYKKVAKAILNDTNSIGTKNAYMQSVLERIAYLVIEIQTAGGKDGINSNIEKLVQDFKRNHPKSIYLGRITYLLGIQLVKQDRSKEGREVFTSLVNDKNISDYIKELAKSELSILNLKDKTL